MENAFKGAIKTKHKFGALNWQQWYPSYSNLRTNKQDIAEKICSSGNSTDTFQRFCCAVLFVRMVAANVGHCQETCLGDLIASWSHHWNANVHTDRNILVLAYATTAHITSLCHGGNSIFFKSFLHLKETSFMVRMEASSLMLNEAVFRLCGPFKDQRHSRRTKLSVVFFLLCFTVCPWKCVECTPSHSPFLFSSDFRENKAATLAVFHTFSSDWTLWYFIARLKSQVGISTAQYPGVFMKHILSAFDSHYNQVQQSTEPVSAYFTCTLGLRWDGYYCTNPELTGRCVTDCL